MDIKFELTDSLTDMLLLQAAVEEISVEEIVIAAIKQFTERNETVV